MLSRMVLRRGLSTFLRVSDLACIALTILMNEDVGAAGKVKLAPKSKAPAGSKEVRFNSLFVCLTWLTSLVER